MKLLKSINKDDILTKLKELGIREGDVVLVHSSIKSFGYNIEGGVDAVIDALLEAVNVEKGCVVVPTLTGTPELSYKNPPVFDVKNSPCWTGLLPETFRKRQGAIRSLHPTHSVAAIGKEASFITNGHEKCHTPCGYNSPYYKLTQMSGKILFLGVTHLSNTTLHMIEELAKVDYHLQDMPVEATIIDNEGKERKTVLKIHRYGTERDFNKIQPYLKQKDVVREVMIEKCKAMLVEANQMMEIVSDLIKKDKMFLVRHREVTIR